jgi:3-methyladenine DNA glycosylase AlkD
MSTAADLVSELKSIAKPERIPDSQRFFKTGVGGYGEGDRFLGINVPAQRETAKKYYDLELPEIKKLLQSPFHEVRLSSLFILDHKYKKADSKNKKLIAKFYLNNRKYVNNWDLVDSSAQFILGDFLTDKPKEILFELAQSENVWDRRIGMIATLAFIRKNNFDTTLKLAKVLLKDKHDLIQKAVGWMLKETGKRNVKTLEEFLEKYAATMPRVMLRYSIEKFSKAKKQYYLQKAKN